MSENKIPLVLSYQPSINMKKNLIGIYESCFLEIKDNNPNFNNILTNCMNQKMLILKTLKENIENDLRPIEVPNIIPEGDDDEDDDDEDDED